MSRDRHLVHPRDEIMRTMERIYRYRMTTTSGGNLSIRERNGDIWITPARVDKGNLTRDDIVCVSPSGDVEGEHPPSSEFPFHQSVYEARPDLGGIVHAHPVALVAFSIRREIPNTRLFHQSRNVCGDVGFAPYALPGSSDLARSIQNVFAEGYRCVIMENHGVVVGGETLQHAFQQFETLEFTARTLLRAGLIGDVRYLTDEQIELPRQRARTLDTFEPGPASSRERELRKRLCEFVRRGYQQRLLISTEGSFSARVDERSFLITPYQVDRSTIELDDLVLVRDGAAETGRTPSRASRNHQAIYDAHPSIGAIVNAYTVNATAFSVTGQPLSSRTIPESYVFLREVGRVPYGAQFTDSEELARRITPEQPIAILENDGVLVTGSDILNTFDRLEVLESTADALIDGRSRGEVQPMSDEVIADLRRAFSI